MCLSCYTGRTFEISNPKEFKKGFTVNTKVYLHTYDNKTIKLSLKQQKEILKNAVALVLTGVDLSTDIWAIQWENDYIPKTL